MKHSWRQVPQSNTKPLLAGEPVGVWGARKSPFSARRKRACRLLFFLAYSRQKLEHTAPLGLRLELQLLRSHLC